MQASFTPQEQQLIDRLREKYGGQRDAQSNRDEGNGPCVSCSAVAPSARHAQPSSTPSRPGSNVEASICPHCHGAGTLIEIYNHRRLENFCKDCDGRGVRVFKNGVEVLPGTASGTTLTSSAADAPAGVAALHSRQAAAAATRRGGSDDEAETVIERAAALQRDLKRIVAKSALCAKERFDTLALLQQPHSSAVVDPEGRERAARNLMAQLDLQLERLELARRRKQLALDRLTAAAAPAPAAANGGVAKVTLDDIIANEGLRA